MRIITYMEAVKEAMAEEMERDASVFMLGEDVGKFGGGLGQTMGLFDKFGPNHFLDTPISEAAIVGAAVGSALLGMRPIADIMFTDFTTCAMDQIVNQAAKARYMSGGKVSVPMVIKLQGGAGRGKAAQHSQSLEAIFAHIPGLKVVMPSTPYDAKGLFKAAVRDNNPVVYIESASLYGSKGEVPEGDYLVELGRGEVKKTGTDISIFTYSFLVHTALAAAETLKAEGIETEVVDLRSLRPLDEDLIMASVKKTHRAVILHEACVSGGFGAEIAARIADRAIGYLDGPIKRLGVPDVPIPFGKSLENYIFPNQEKLMAVVREVLKG